MPNRKSNPKTNRRRLNRAFDDVRLGSSVSAAAKKHHIGVRRLGTFIRANATVDTKRGRRLLIVEDRRRERSAIDLPKTDPLQIAFDRVRQGDAYTAVAKDLGINPGRLRRYLFDNADLVRERGRIRIVDDLRPATFSIFSNARRKRVTVLGEQKRLAGRYMAAVRKFRTKNDYADIEPFIGMRVRDIKRDLHPFETRPNVLRELFVANDVSDDAIYAPGAFL